MIFCGWRRDNVSHRVPRWGAGKMKKIDTCTAYWQEIVTLDRQAFQKSTDNLRLAFHLSISLFHMSDWVYASHKNVIDREFSFVDKNGKNHLVHDDKSFANAITDLNGNFGLIRGIANAEKHLEIRKPLNAHTHAPSHAANTRSRTIGFQQDAFQKNAFMSKQCVMLEGPNGNDLGFQEISDDVYDLWLSLDKQYGWNI